MDNKNHYLIHLTLTLGEYEKSNFSVVLSSSEEEAIEIALRGECHNEPDFNEFPDKDAVWDGGEYVYTADRAVLLTEEQYNVLKELRIAW
jgi:hypothetical protein